MELAYFGTGNWDLRNWAWKIYSESGKTIAMSVEHMQLHSN